jgi:glycosyltransferase involved in cell wall biosynthesis
MHNIAIEVSNICAPRPTGITKFSMGLIEALMANDDFRRNFNPTLFYKLSRFKQRQYRFRPPNVPAQWYLNPVLPIKKNYGLIHCFGTNMIRWKKAKVIATIHDLAIFKKQHQYELYSPKTYRDKRFQEFKTIADRADTVVTVSNNTKTDFLEMFDYPQEKTHVILEGIDSRFFKFKNNPENHEEIKSRFGIKRRYVLFVGAVSVRKNTINLIKAFQQSRCFEDCDLVLAGPPAHGYAEIKKAIEETGMEKYIIETGYIDDDRLLPPLYANAAAFFFPTYYEGFGIPILEAMACRTPVLIGDKGAAPEIAAGWAINCNPFDLDSITDGIKRVLTDNAVDIEAAHVHARTFTWAACADKVFDTYIRIIN